MSWTISYRMATTPGPCVMSMPLLYRTGSVDPSAPREMQRSHIEKSSGLSSCAPKSVPFGAAAVRACPAGVIDGIRPSGGSTSSDVCSCDLPHSTQ